MHQLSARVALVTVVGHLGLRPSLHQFTPPVADRTQRAAVDAPS